MKNKNQANRGISFEELIDYANRWYFEKGIGLIQKIPTDWKVIRSYNARSKKNEIVSAFPARKATVDFIGLYYNRPIAFDAKSTQNKTRFPLSNIEDHQQDFLKRWRMLGGKAFYLIHFAAYQRTFILTQKKLDEFQQQEQRKSIPYSFFLESCIEVKAEGTNVLHYLKDMF